VFTICITLIAKVAVGYTCLGVVIYLAFFKSQFMFTPVSCIHCSPYARKTNTRNRIESQPILHFICGCSSSNASPWWWM